MGAFIRKENGRTYLQDTDTKRWYPVDNQTIKSDQVGDRKQNTRIKGSKFKLLTIRKIEGLGLATVAAQVRATQANIESIALLTGQPIVAPIKLPEENGDLSNYYSCYVDEDLYGTLDPVFTFYSGFGSPKLEVKAYVTANGADKEDWSLHIAWITNSVDLESNFPRRQWQILTIDNASIDSLNTGTASSTRQVYTMTSADLPRCFETNFSLSDLHYSGGGIWTAMAIDIEDSIPQYGVVSGTDSRYRKIANSFSTPGKQYSIVSYSATPSYSFTWCRGQLKVNKRLRDASVILDNEFLKNTGTIRQKRSSNYSLNLTLRPQISSSLPLYEKTEFCTSTAFYVGNTNYPIGSPRKSPDYGTDVARWALNSYTQTSNVVRGYSIPPSGVVAASNNGAYLLRMEIGTAEGNLTQPFATKHAIGTRGVSYAWFEKRWWAYGEVLATYPTTPRQYTYIVSRFNGQIIPSTFFVDVVNGAAPYGELRKTAIPNVVETTWDVPVNPDSGFYSVRQGEFSFVLKYRMPPLFSHDAVYYYQRNPRRVGGLYADASDRYYDASSPQVPPFSLAPSFSNVAAADGNSTQNGYISVYTQILGAMANSFVSSYNLGYRPIASNDLDSIVVLSPTPDQKGDLANEPSLFPNAYIASPFLSESWDNDNKYETSTYDVRGTKIS